MESHHIIFIIIINIIICFVCFLEEICLKEKVTLRETESGLNGIMGRFMVATYTYLCARSSCKASVPENGKVERNNVGLRFFPAKINYMLMIIYEKIFVSLKSSHLPDKKTIIRVR
jgi:hypothetical protein